MVTCPIITGTAHPSTYQILNLAIATPEAGFDPQIPTDLASGAASAGDSPRFKPQEDNTNKATANGTHKGRDDTC